MVQLSRVMKLDDVKIHSFLSSFAVSVNIPQRVKVKMRQVHCKIRAYDDDTQRQTDVSWGKNSDDDCGHDFVTGDVTNAPSQQRPFFSCQIASNGIEEEIDFIR